MPRAARRQNHPVRTDLHTPAGPQAQDATPHSARTRRGRTLRARTAAAIAATVSGALVLSGCTATNSVVGGLPDPLVLTTYGTSTGSYADLAAVADRVSVDTGARVRIITSDTSVGRLAALRSGAAQVGRLGDEYIFGFEGVNEFANQDWGPQDIRVAWVPLSPHGVMTRTADGLDEMSDLRGKRIPHYTANPSANAKVQALLAYGGLTPDDVEWVNIGYGEQADALQQGQVDMIYGAVYGGSFFELASQVSVQWVDLDPDDAEAVDRLQTVVPAAQVGSFDRAPAQEEGDSDHGIYYSVAIAAYDEIEDETIYNLIDSMVDTYPAYKDSTISLPRWDPEEVVVEPQETPFHDGTVQWLKDHDRWTDEAQEKQDELTERGERLHEEWDRFMESEPEDEDTYRLWLEWKRDNGLAKESEEITSGFF